VNLYKSRLSIQLPWVIVSFAAFWIFVFGLASKLLTDKSWFGQEGIVWLFAVGAVPGMCVALAQFFLSWAEFAQMGKLQKLGVKNVLPTRDDAAYYGKLIDKANEQIVFVGGTGRRFFQDFADKNSPRLEKKTLMKALDRGVQVRVLVTTPDHLNDRQRDGLRAAQTRCIELKAEYPQFFEARTLKHPMTYSLVQVDGDLIVGPVFPNTESKDTPVVHFESGNAVAESYLADYDREWNNADPFTSA
jgi:hypothetical protein